MLNMEVAPIEVQEEILRLPANPTMADFQAYVIELKKLRAFNTRPDHAYILMTKECGELAAAMRTTWLDPSVVEENTRTEIGLEIADILIYLLDVANQYGISVEEAFRAKEEANKRRSWPEYYHSH